MLLLQTLARLPENYYLLLPGDGALLEECKETAAALGVSRPTVYQLIKRSDFPVLRVGGRTLISADGLRSWVEAQAERGDTDARV